MADKFIYVTGFPKSGNTWLSRLVARVAEAPVVGGLMRGNEEIAADVNKLIEKESNFRTAKIHFLPEAFTREVDANPSRVIYIYRDYRDIIISAFYYFHPEFKNLPLERLHPFQVGYYNPFRQWQIHQNRKKLFDFIQSYTMQGVPNNPDFGTWQEHYCNWRDYLQNNASIQSTFVCYEDLLEDTSAEVKRALSEVEVPYSTDEDALLKIVQEESFSNKKEYFKKLMRSNQKDAPGGVKMNYQFLRSGKSGEWKRYFSKGIKDYIEQKNGALLTTLGYL